MNLLQPFLNSLIALDPLRFAGQPGDREKYKECAEDVGRSTTPQRKVILQIVADRLKYEAQEHGENELLLDTQYAKNSWLDHWLDKHPTVDWEEHFPIHTEPLKVLLAVARKHGLDAVADLFKKLPGPREVVRKTASAAPAANCEEAAGSLSLDKDKANLERGKAAPWGRQTSEVSPPTIASPTPDWEKTYSFNEIITDMLPLPGAPGYFVNDFGMVWGEKAKGRRAGFVKPDRGWRIKKGRKKPSFSYRYRLTINGKQQRISVMRIAMMRTNLERDRKAGA